MWKSIKQELTVQRSILIWTPAVTLIGWLFGVVLMTVVTGIFHEEEGFCIGTVIALFVCVLMGVIFGGMVIWQGFDDAVHMGKTRKHFLPSAALVIFLSAFLSFALSGILARVENLYYQNVLGNTLEEADLKQFLTPVWLLVYAMAVTGMACSYGGILKANRKIGGPVCLVIWLTMCWSMNGIGGVEEDEGRFFLIFARLGNVVSLWFGSLPIWMRQCCLALIGLAGFGIMYTLLIRRAAD